MTTDKEAPTPTQNRKDPDWLGDWIARWVSDSTLRPSSLETYVYALGSLASFGVARIDQLTAPSVKSYLIQRRADGSTPATCNKALAGFISFARWLRTQGKFSRTGILDLRELRYKLQPSEPPRWLTEEEVVRLYEAMKAINPLAGLAVLLDVNTGLRACSELLVAQGDAFVLDGDEPYYKVHHPTKNKRFRTTPIPKAFAEELKALGFPRRGFVFPSLGQGKHLNRNTLEGWMRQGREDANLGSDVTFITLRHTFASWHILFGNVSIAKVSRWMGNSVAVCERHYLGLQNAGDSAAERGFEKLATVRPPRPLTSSRILALESMQALRRSMGMEPLAPAKAANETSEPAPIAQPSSGNVFVPADRSPGWFARFSAEFLKRTMVEEAKTVVLPETPSMGQERSA